MTTPTNLEFAILPPAPTTPPTNGKRQEELKEKAKAIAIQAYEKFTQFTTDEESGTTIKPACVLQ